MEKDGSHSHRYNPDDQRSTSQAGVLKKDAETKIFNNSHFSELITRTSEIDNLTAHTIHKDDRYVAVWIGVPVVAGIFLLCFLN